MYLSKHRKILGCLALAAIAFMTLSFAGNSDDEVSSDAIANDNLYRYDHIDNIVDQYCDMLMSIKADSKDMEELLMDINSRSQKLMIQGDTMTALYFHHAIEENMRKRDYDRAEIIFGESPHSAFNIDV